VSETLPLDEFSILHTGSIVSLERLPDEEDKDVPGPLVTGVNIPFNGNVRGGGIWLHTPFKHLREMRNDCCSLLKSRSTVNVPEGSRRSDEAGKNPPALVDTISGGSGGGSFGRRQTGGVTAVP
jgi:hypothetical protein